MIKWTRGVNGQVIAEYFILLAVIALVTVLGLASTRFGVDLKKILEDFFTAASGRIAVP